ncbi:MAG: hypothetical protein MZU79_05515 [Anaerotruncus sp.]|nr:hypothetical protein [Anaerotruncus sp.]
MQGAPSDCSFTKRRTARAVSGSGCPAWRLSVMRFGALKRRSARGHRGRHPARVRHHSGR